MINLMQGDCLDKMSLIPDNSVDLILQDPPYNITDCKWEWDILTKIDELWLEWNRIIKPNGAIVMFGFEPFSSKLRLSNIKNYKYDWIWHKNNASGFVFAKYQPMRNHEIISVFYSKQPTYNPIKQPRSLNTTSKKRLNYKYTSTKGNIELYKIKKIQYSPENIELSYPKTIQYVPSVSNGSVDRVHPSQKPVKLMEYLIKTYTNDNEVVFDGFMGSGTTGVACRNLKRSFIGIELDKKYFDIANKRVNKPRLTDFKI